MTLPPRRLSLILLAVISLTVVYLVGVTRFAGTLAAASTRAITSVTQPPTKPSTKPSTQPSTQPAAIAGVGGTGITVGSTAAVAGTPDTLRLDLTVVATGPSVSTALAEANRSADAVQKSLLGNGVTRKDLQTSGLNITPTYTSVKGGSARLTGYEVSESVSAKLRDLNRAGDAIGKAVDAGGNAVRVNGISLDLEETGALVTTARDKAFADAKAKAEQYAKAAGRPLGDVESIAENVGTASPRTDSYAESLKLGQFSGVPVQPGSQEVTVTVTVVFAMR